MEARRKVNNNGSISCTASRVAGSDPLKMITPVNHEAIRTGPGADLSSVESTTLTSRYQIGLRPLEHRLRRW